VRKDRRLSPRLELGLPVQIVAADGLALSATTVNVSLDGMQCSCDSHTARRVVPRGHVPMPGQSIEARVRLNLPFSERAPGTVDVRCRVVVLRRLAENEYRMGLEYVHLEGDSYRDLGEYIAERIHGG
jgi:c-di-GMP-binding flagellar brake protein YcgR